MQNLVELFAEKKVRAIFDETNDKWWFSVADICAAINGIDHAAARNYWKWLRTKWKKEQIELVSDTNRIDFATAAGTAHFSDAMDVCGVLRLLMAYPSPRAVPFRLWFVEILADNPEVIEQFDEIGALGSTRNSSKRPLHHKNISVRDLFNKTIDG